MVNNYGGYTLLPEFFAKESQIEQKNILQQKLVNKINSDGYLLVKSQTERSQLGNKEQVIKKMNMLPCGTNRHGKMKKEKPIQ